MLMLFQKILAKFRMVDVARFNLTQRDGKVVQLSIPHPETNKSWNIDIEFQRSPPAKQLYSTLEAIHFPEEVDEYHGYFEYDPQDYPDLFGSD
jgi:hypothetical protein